MRNRFKISLWMLPLLGIVLGILSAFIFVHGLAVTWQFVGKPTSNIDKIMGLSGGKLLVYTNKGGIYSLPLRWGTGNLIPVPVEWEKVENHNIELDPIHKLGSTDFIVLPPLFKVKQIFETDISVVEGLAVIKFALSEDGNLWTWQYGIGTMPGLTYLFFPIIGGISGMVLAMFIQMVLYLMKVIKE